MKSANTDLPDRTGLRLKSLYGVICVSGIKDLHRLHGLHGFGFRVASVGGVDGFGQCTKLSVTPNALCLKVLFMFGIYRSQLL